MQMRLTDSDMKHVEIAQGHFSRIQPVAVHMTPADVVRLGLRHLTATLGKQDKIIQAALREIEPA